VQFETETVRGGLGRSAGAGMGAGSIPQIREWTKFSTRAGLWPCTHQRFDR